MKQIFRALLLPPVYLAPREASGASHLLPLRLPPPQLSVSLPSFSPKPSTEARGHI